MCATDSHKAGVARLFSMYVNGNEKSLSLIWNGKKLDSKRAYDGEQQKKEQNRSKIKKTTQRIG